MMHKNRILESDSFLKSEALVKLEQADAIDNEPNNTESYGKGEVKWNYSPFISVQENSFGQPEVNTIDTHLRCVKSELGEYVCSICGLETGTASRLRRHLKIHAKEKTHHSCIPNDGTLHKFKNCFSKITKKSSFRNHKKNHDRIKEFRYEECPAAYINQPQLEAHTIQHASEKIYHDQECGEGFATATRLSYHQVTHTAERPYQGEVYGEKLQEKTALITHKSVHLTRGPYICNMCGEMFPRINSLTLHQRVHQTDSTYSYVPQNCKPIKETVQESRKESPLSFPSTSDILFKDTYTQNENKPPVREEIPFQEETHEETLNTRNVTLQNFQEDIPISSTTEAMASFKVQGEKYTFAGNVMNIPHPDIVQEALATGTLLESQGEDGQIYLIVLPRTISEQDYTHVTLPSKIPSVTAPTLISGIESVSQQNQGLEENSCNLLMWDNELNIAEGSLKPDSEEEKSDKSKNKEEYVEEDSSSKENESHASSKKFVSTRIKQMGKSKEKKLYTYECKNCGKKCKNSSSFVIHMRTHTGERPYYCGYCGIGFKQVTHLKSHIRIHTGEKPYKCSQCDAAFHQSSQLHAHFKTWHIRKHERMREKVKVRGSIQNFYCKICDKTFVNSCFKKQHMKTHTDEMQYMCNKCEATFKTKSKLHSHEKLHINDSFKICELCGLHFKDVSSLNHHRLAIHDLSKEESDITRFLDEKNLSKRNETETSNGGDSCGSLANVNHASMMSKECCGLEHTYDIKKSSKNVQTHSCKICHKTFKQKANLNTHMRVHTDERPFKCEECGSAFHQISHLKDHVKIHSGEKPFKCSVCLALFVQSSAAKTHIKKHHSGQAIVIKEERSDFLAKESIILQEIPKSDDDNTVVINIENSASLSVEVQIERNALGIFEEGEKDAGVQKNNRKEGPVYQDRKESINLSHDNTKNTSEIKKMGVSLTPLLREATHFCIICQKTFRRTSALKFHVKMSHTHGNKRDVGGNIL